MRGIDRLTSQVVLVVLLGLGGPPSAAAQSLTLGTVQGIVVDEAGRGLGAVPVRLSSSSGGASRSVLTRRDGSFVIPLVAPGTYELGAERLGYRPHVVRNVSVRPGADVYVQVALVTAPPPVTVVDTSVFVGTAGVAVAGGWYPTDVLRDQSLTGRGLTDVLVLGPGGPNEIAGLPAWLAAVDVDGLRVPVAVHPGFGADPEPVLAWSREAFVAAEYDGSMREVERPGAPAGLLAGYLARGARRLSVRAAGDWQPRGIATSKFFSPGGADVSSYGATLGIAGPIIPDTAQFALTLAVEDRAVAHPAPWSGAIGSDSVIGAARDSWAQDLTRWQLPWSERRRSVRVAGRFDWLVAERHMVSAQAGFGQTEIAAPDFGRDRLGWLDARLEGVDWHAGVAVVSRLGQAANELRVGFGRSERSYLPAGSGRTTLVSEALGIGASAGYGGVRARRTITLTEVLHLPAGAHRVSIGTGLLVDAAEATWAWGTGGDAFYADATRFGAGDGAVLTVAGVVPPVRHSHFDVGVWFQDTWRAAPGLDVLFGLRVDGLLRPREAVAPNVAWLAETGLNNAAYDPSIVRLSPRGGLRWTPGQRRLWQVRLEAVSLASLDEADVFSELIAHDGRVTVRRTVGALGAWPDAAGSGPARPRLALLAPGYVPPRAGRFGVDVLGALGAVTLRFAGTYRHTDFLPRRTNLNRLPGSAGTDQYGRPLYGALIQQGSLLSADPLTNRRFAEFDLVSAVNADGAQDRWEATVAVERRVGAALGLLLSYTWSRTEDNWLGALGGGPDDQLDPFPDRLGGQVWSEGTSDLDVPHRFVAAIDLRPIRGIRLGGLFRLESGVPFTPGFRPGVDANADGSARNDPAFVDPALPGMAAVLAAWPCLAVGGGQFAERNACRRPTTQALDLWFRLDLPRIGGMPLALTITALNVVEPDRAWPDAALLLVDPATALTTDPTTGRVTVPLLVNPNFGEPLVRRGSARVLRIGLRVNN